MPETFMETSQRVAGIDRRLAAIEQRRGATEPRLTGCMAMILDADAGASAALARILLDTAPNVPDDRRVSRIPARCRSRGRGLVLHNSVRRPPSSGGRRTEVWGSKS
jgi:hypothetical protein